APHTHAQALASKPSLSRQPRPAPDINAQRGSCSTTIKAYVPETRLGARINA
ncbi:hypothetical protein PIB30_081008, partial [Stylosanthes scabra]|nr:hypothetical protein [Stylosanthes scabra]